MIRSYLKLTLAVLLAVALTGRAGADPGCCAHCGCQVPCKKVCRLVCEEKEVEVICWGCKREEFCVPCHSKPGCCHSESVCDECDSCDPAVPHTGPKRFVWFDWFPGGARIYTRTKLMRKSELVTMPSYKWVVEELCAECTAKVEHAGATRVVETPATPGSVMTR